MGLQIGKTRVMEHVPNFQLGVRWEKALVVRWSALGFFAYSLWGSVWEFGDGKIVGGGRTGSKVGL